MRETERIRIFSHISYSSCSTFKYFCTFQEHHNYHYFSLLHFYYMNNFNRYQTILSGRKYFSISGFIIFGFKSRMSIIFYAQPPGGVTSGISRSGAPRATWRSPPSLSSRCISAPTIRWGLTMCVTCAGDLSCGTRTLFGTRTR